MTCNQEGCPSCHAREFCSGCVECFYWRCSEQCASCPVVCGRRKDLSGWLEEVTIGSRYQISTTRMPLDEPRWFPTIVPVSGILSKVHLSFIVLPVARFFNPASLTFRAFGLKKHFGIDPKTILILSFNVKDPVLERIWSNRELFYFNLRKTDVDLIITPNFSNWHSNPRLEYFLNVERGLMMGQEMSAMGYRLIVDVCGVTNSVSERYLSLLKPMKPGTLHFNFQFARTKMMKQDAVDLLVLFHSRLPVQWDFLLQGLSIKNPGEKIFSHLPGRRVYCTSASPMVAAMNRRPLTGRNKEAVAGADPAVLFAQYVEHYERAFKP